MKKILVLFLLVMLVGCTRDVATQETTWEESPTLVREVIASDDGRVANFVFRIGDNGRFGFGEYGPFIAGKEQKYMWHFWGDKETLSKSFKVIGISKETDEEITIIHTQGIGNSPLSPNTGADHHIPSLMMLPSPGLWKLMVYFGEEHFGNIIVEVKEE